jgi:hypothetical protein
MADLRWWTGWTAKQTTAALDANDVEEVTLDDGATAFVLADDVAPVRTRRTGSRSSRDSIRRRWAGGTATGTSARTARRCSTRTATQVRPSGQMATLSAGGASAPMAPSSTGSSSGSTRQRRRRSTRSATRLTAWFDGVRVTPRFRTPLEKELAAG